VCGVHRCASGGSYGYRQPSYATPSLMGYSASLQAMRRAQLQAAAEAQAARVLRQMADAAQRLQAADRAYHEGDIRLASRIYVRLAGSRRPDPITLQARDRLTRLAQMAREELGEIDARLVPAALMPDGSAHAPNPGPLPPDRVCEAFQDYEEILAKYAGVPAAKREITAHVARQRRQPQYAAVLNEDRAKQLLELAQSHEQCEELCCAYWVYQQAARLVPAPSALRAQERFDALAADPELIRSAEVCRELRWCHSAFERAEMLVKLRPESARNLFGEILRRAPEDSEIHRAARAEYEALTGQGRAVPTTR
jgi:hypothetical protein